jgi:hypothetical protein
MTFQGVLRPFQEEAVDMLLERRSLLLAHRMGLGKGSSIYEPVLTPSGWRPMGSLRVGEFVIGQNGHQTKIVGVFPQGKQEIFRIEMNDGSWCEVIESHLWQVQHVRRGYWRTFSTKEILDGGLRDSSGNLNWRIPMVAAVKYETTSPRVRVNPYLLGIWLGNGSRSSLGMNANDGYLVDRYCQTGKIIERSNESKYWVGRLLPKYTLALQLLGLYEKRSWEKSIPNEYLTISRKGRLALLQGLMDTDGSPVSDGGGTEFSSTSEALIDQVVELVQSLGGIAKKKGPRVTNYTHNGEKRKGRPSWRLNIKLPVELEPFRSQRKLDKWIKPTKYPVTRLIKKIESTGRHEEAVCIKVAADDQLYVTRHFIVTHNTVTSIAAVEELIDSGEVECALILCPASIKWQWKRQIEKFTDGALIKVIEGPKPNRMAQYRSVKRGDCEYVIMNYEQVVNDWDYVRLLHFDAVVADEVTAIKNAGSLRSRHVKRLGRSPNCYRFGLSGQPIENRPEELFSIMEWIDPKVLGNAQVFDRLFIKRGNYGMVKHYKNLPMLRKKMKTAMHRKTRQDVADQMPSIVEESYIIDFDAPALKLYKYIVKDLLGMIYSTPKFSTFNLLSHYAGVEDNSAQGEVMARLTALRMLCDHPALLDFSADKFDDPDSKAGSKYIADLRNAGLFGKLKGSPKMDVTLEVINEILEADPDYKVVVFSFFKPMLALLGEKLKCDYALFTGDLTSKERDEQIEYFQTNKNCRVFLSSDAGGVGVDLPQANYLISYDLPWSAGKWEQRNGRIDRLSSEWPEITLLSMLMRNSVEERMFEMLEEKSAIAAAWLDGKKVDKQGNFTLTLGTLADFLMDRVAT